MASTSWCSAIASTCASEDGFAPVCRRGWVNRSDSLLRLRPMVQDRPDQAYVSVGLGGLGAATVGTSGITVGFNIEVLKYKT